MAEGNEVVGVIAIVTGLVALWRAEAIGGFIGNFHRNATNTVAARVVALIFIAAGIYFIAG